MAALPPSVEKVASSDSAFEAKAMGNYYPRPSSLTRASGAPCNLISGVTDTLPDVPRL